jgi:hypothetical protein
VLIRRAVLDQIATGDITLQFRRWRRPTVRTGGTLITAIGQLAIGSVSTVEPAEISEADAQAAGYRDVAALLADVRPEGTLYRVEVAVAGDDPRIALRTDDRLDVADRAALDARLARFDAASTHGPWTAATLAVIAEHPGVRAGDLADRLGRERLSFKTDVRKLKALGLTESLEVGYRLSPRGHAYRSG